MKWFMEYHGGYSCERCRYKTSPRAIQFHHLPKGKERVTRPAPLKTLNCHACGHYHDGKGDNDCITCSKVASMIPRNSPTPQSIPWPETAIENMPKAVETIQVLDALSKIERMDAIVFCERYIIQLSVKEIALLHRVTERQIQKRLNIALREVRQVVSTGAGI